MNRSRRALMAQEAIAIVDRGDYKTANGRTVNLAPAVQACLAGTRYLQPNELERIRQQTLSRSPGETAVAIEVRNETTLAGIARVLVDGGGPVAALNFASAKNPGGGFLNGSQAQEESLARSSALYASQMQAFEFYERHRGKASCLYSDAMILSPDCPIFRDDDDSLLETPQVATFITSAAPNAGAIAKNSPKELPLIEHALRRRAEYVLALAAWSGHPDLVLGAWGCGVFRNDSQMVADVFAKHLLEGAWRNRFRRVAFSVLDGTEGKEVLGAFERTFV